MCGIFRVAAIAWALAACASPALAETVALKYHPLASLENLYTPTFYDIDHDAVAVLPAGKRTFELHLPRAPRDLILVGPTPRAFFVDVNGNGKLRDKGETFRLGRNGSIGPVVVRLDYEVKKDTAPIHERYAFLAQPLPQVGLSVPAPSLWRMLRVSGRFGKALKRFPVLVTDDNFNGRFNDYGVDGLVTGRWRGLAVGSLLSPVTLLGGKLYELAVNAPGTELKLNPYTGDTGGLDLLSNYTPPTKSSVVGVVIRSKTRSFVIRRAGVVRLPPDAYHVMGGLIVRGKETARILPGTMPSFRVEKKMRYGVKWGDPFKIDFTLSDRREQGLRATDVVITGSEGERYVPLSTGRNSIKIAVARIRRRVVRGMIGGFDEWQPMANGRIVLDHHGSSPPFVFVPTRTGKYEMVVTYKSAIFGVLTAKKRIEWRKPDPPSKAK